MKAIGIIGLGFVGEAVYETMKNSYSVETYDIVKESTCDSISDLCKKVDVVFLCLPTPMREDGSCDLSIVESVVFKVNKHSEGKVLIVKSTVPPGTTESLNNQNDNVDLVFSPEFLTEANYIDDFKNQDRIIIGGEKESLRKVRDIFYKVFDDIPIIETDFKTAEMVKYFANCFLATKVIFANEMKQFCDAKEIDFDKVVEYALYDDRIGKSHLQVPGHDDRLGFGGSCFPKDINALIYEMGKVCADSTVLSAVWEKNLKVRPERDWEKLEGRAVSKKGEIK